MIAVDTNVIIRYLVGDDPQQTARATALMESQPIFVPVTVFVEVAWVLRSFYRFEPAKVVAALRALAGLRNVTMQHANAVHRALEWAADGVQIADALHVATAEQVSAFLTFDRAFAKSMAGRAPVPVHLLP